MIKRIAIRFGHTILINGLNTASQGIKDEYLIIREYAPLVIKYLKQQGYEVFNITPKDKSYSTEIKDINAGIKIANDWKADLFISCHANNFDATGQGCEVLYSNGNIEGQTISTNICKELETLGFKNRGAKVDIRGLNEITKTHMTSCIIEPLFCDSVTDMKLYNADNIARAIVKGITGKQVLKDTKYTNPIIVIPNKPKEVWKTVIATTLNVRSSPSIKSDNQIGELHEGNTVEVDKVLTNGWTSIFYGNHGGYVSSQYLK